MANEPVLLTAAGGESLGLFKVGGRMFKAVPLKIKEGRTINALYKDGAGLARYPEDGDFTPVLCPILSARSEDGKPVKADWLEDNASGTDYANIMALLQNPATYPERMKAKKEAKEGDTKNA